MKKSVKQRNNKLVWFTLCVVFRWVSATVMSALLSFHPAQAATSAARPLGKRLAVLAGASGAFAGLGALSFSGEGSRLRQNTPFQSPLNPSVRPGYSSMRPEQGDLDPLGRRPSVPRAHSQSAAAVSVCLGDVARESGRGMQEILATFVPFSSSQPRQDMPEFSCVKGGWFNRKFQIRDSRQFANAFWGEQELFTALEECNETLMHYANTGLLCLPEQGRAKMVSPIGMVMSVPHRFESLEACHASLQAASKPISRSEKLACLPQKGEFQAVSFSDPYQQIKIPSAVLGASAFHDLVECSNAIESGGTRDRVRAFLDVHYKLNEIAKRKDFASGEMNLKELSDRFPYLGHLWSRSARVSEGYTVGEHTKRVLSEFDDQAKFYPLREIEERNPSLGSLEALLRATILLHDIGKSLGAPSGQHAFTTPILEHFLKLWGFNESQVVLAKELSDHDAIGAFLQGYRPGESVQKSLEERAARANLSKADFFALQKLYYVCDAASYPSVRNQVFTSHLTQGRLKILDPDFEELERRMSKP